LSLSQNNYSKADGLNLKQHLVSRGPYLQINPRLHERLLFHHHALGHDGVFNEFGLILCRNVMIYFDTEMQLKVLRLFAQSLHREGFLLLGPSDGLSLLAREAGFRPDPRGQQLYRLEEWT
jgi:chemotaxis protein methyltransferase CheR